MAKDITTRWDLSSLAPETPEKFTAQLEASVKEAISLGNNYRGKIASLDAKRLLDALQSYENLQKEVIKPQYYAHLLFAEDSGSDMARRLSQEAAEAGN